MRQVLYILALVTGSCTPFVRYHDVMVEFRENPDGSWLYQDEDVILEFKVVNGPRFFWRFKNTSLLPLEIDHRDVSLYLEDDPVSYTLWGADKKEMAQFPLLRLEPGDYIRLEYPILIKSPLFPFDRERATMLDMIIRWNGKPTHYRFIIPALPKTGEEPQEPPADRAKVKPIRS